MFLKILFSIFFLITAVMAVIAWSTVRGSYFQISESGQPKNALQEIHEVRATSSADTVDTIKKIEDDSESRPPATFNPQSVSEKPTTLSPVIRYTEKTNAELASSEVLKWTNEYRIENGLKTLSRNSFLDSAAIIKMRDMFEKGYFEHVSPSGEDISGLARSVNYEYLAIGENLALGNFKDEKDLVDAWMASPGHRANILKTNFEEIGIALGKGNFDGRNTWIIVQEFGRPLSSCPAVSKKLPSDIEMSRSEISLLKSGASVLRSEIENEAMSETLSFQKIEEYNRLIEKINALIEKTAAMIEKYNTSVQEYNTCLSLFV